MRLLQNTTQMRWQTLIPTILSADAVERLDRDFRGAERLAFGLIFSGRVQTRRIDGSRDLKQFSWTRAAREDRAALALQGEHSAARKRISCEWR